MPAMGESVTEGTVLEWHKQEGDAIEADETLVEISTDKVDAEVPSPAARHDRQDPRRRGRHREVGAVLAEISPATAATRRDGRGANGESPRRERGRRDATAPRPTTTPRRDPRHRHPAGGESVTEGTILEWAVKVGDTVGDGDTIVEISTDKVDMELPAPAGRHDHRDPRRGGRDGHRRPGHRAHAGRRGAGGAAPAAPRRPARAPASGAAAPAPAARPTRQGLARRRARRRRRGRRPRRRRGTGPRRPHHQGRRAGRRGRQRRRHGGRRAGAAAGARALKGGAAMLARYMDESRVDPDRDLVPHDHRHRRWTRGASSSRTPARRSPSPT